MILRSRRWNDLSHQPYSNHIQTVLLTCVCPVFSILFSAEGRNGPHSSCPKSFSSKTCKGSISANPVQQATWLKKGQAGLKAGNLLKGWRRSRKDFLEIALLLCSKELELEWDTRKFGSWEGPGYKYIEQKSRPFDELESHSKWRQKRLSFSLDLEQSLVDLILGFYLQGQGDPLNDVCCVQTIFVNC